MRKNRIAGQTSEISILALDDDEIMTLTLQAYFQSAGYRIDIENDPVRAVERVRGGNYDILLLDFLMSPICGDKVVAKIREFNQDLYIILLTGHKSMAPPIKTIRELDIQGYYEKSDRFDQLELLVESCVKSIRQMRTIREYRDGLTEMIGNNPRLYQLQPMDDFLAVALAGALKCVKAQNGFLYLDTPEGGIGHGTGPYEENLAKMREEYRAAINGEELLSGKRALLFREKEEPLGVLGVELPMPCGWEKDQLFALYARQVSAALGNAKMHLLLNENKEKLDSAYDLLNTSAIQMAEMVRSLVDARDSYTRGHSDRVSYLAVQIAKAMGKDAAYLERIRLGGLFHDIGKIGIPDGILLKADRLTEQEYEEIKKHAARGADMLKGIRFFQRLCPIIRAHHERIDGKGYPDGLSGTEIPEEARIIAVVDAFDAMTSHRAYRKDMTPEEARDELIQGKGTQFDSEVVDVFLSLFTDFHIMEQEMHALCGEKTFFSGQEREESQ